jgi:hypothetical protein
MIKLFQTSLLFVLIISCQSSIEPSSDTFSKESISRFSHVYDNEIKVSTTEVIYSMDDSLIYDSLKYLETYSYNSNNKIISKNRVNKKDGSSELSFYQYENDSLILHYTINSTGDTTEFLKYSLHPDRKRLIEEKYLFEKSLDKSVNYDTVHYTYVYDFENDKMIQEKQYDNGLLVNSRVLSYSSNGVLISSQKYIYANEVPFKDNVFYYDIPTETGVYEVLELSPLGDTVTYKKNHYQNNNLKSTKYVYREYGVIREIVFNRDGKIVKESTINRPFDLKTENQFEYYPNGDIKAKRIIKVYYYEH